MLDSSRLNLLVTHRVGMPAATRSPWYQTMTQLLAPLGVRTFEATSAPQAIALIEQHPIHLAVVDTRLEGTDGQLGVLRLIQKLREHTRVDTAFTPPGGAEPLPGTGHDVPHGSFRVEVQMHARPDGGRIEVHFGGSAAPGAGQGIRPTVILLTPSRDDALLQEALKCEAFSVMTEPVDLNLMLDLMARALRRFHQNLWPQ